MQNFSDYVARQNNTQSVSEDVGEVPVIRSLGLDAASVALPAGIDLEDRAARMNEFWKKLVDYQHRDVVVVALCATGDH